MTVKIVKGYNCGETEMVRIFDTLMISISPSHSLPFASARNQREAFMIAMCKSDHIKSSRFRGKHPAVKASSKKSTLRDLNLLCTKTLNLSQSGSGSTYQTWITQWFNEHNFSVIKEGVWTSVQQLLGIPRRYHFNANKLWLEVQDMIPCLRCC